MCINKETVAKKGAFAAVFLGTLMIVLAIGAAYVNNKFKMECAQMEQLVVIKSNKVNDVLCKLLYKTQVLSALVIQNNGGIRDFEKVAATIVDDPAIRNVILAPGGVVKKVYPLKGNEGVIGLDYFSAGKGNIEALQAKNGKRGVLGGPFDLVQGGQALVGRLPVYTGRDSVEEKFWGLVSVTLNYPEALNGAELDQLKAQGFAFEIWRINPDDGKRQVIAHSSYLYDKGANYVEKPLTILNAEWYFRLSPIRRFYQYPETWMFFFAGLLVSWLIASLVGHNHDLKKIKVELEELTGMDLLTGTLNRRGLFKELGALMGVPGAEFILCYIDLDKFKEVNDSYGHMVGDRVLKHVAAVIGRRIDAGSIFARIGGDEFVLIFKDTDDREMVKAFFDKIAGELLDSLNIAPNGDRLDITFSMGMAAYPSQAKDIDGLIGVADRAMYKDKKQG